MHSTFVRNKNGKVVAASAAPFKTEDEFERFVMDAKMILPGIFILKRQIRAGRDIPDMVGIDHENNAVIIENKNTPVDEQILTQITRYAVWADTHQDAIRAWWYEAKDRPHDIDVDWDHLQIRLMVLAPSIKPNVLRLQRMLGFEVDFIEVKRFVVGQEEIIVVNQLESPEEELRGPTKGMKVYDKAFYKEHHNPKSVDAFLDLVAALKEIVEKNGWNLIRKFNANDAVFNRGFFNVFGVVWWNAKSFGVFAKLPKSAAAKAKRLCPYSSDYNGRYLNFEATEKTVPQRLTPLLKFAYESFVEKDGGE